MAVAYDGEEFTFHNPDGSELRVRGFGNQFSAVFETIDGYTVVRDPATGYYTYADVSSDRDRLESTGLRAGAQEGARLSLPKHLRVRRTAARAEAEVARSALEGRPRWEERREQRKERLRTHVAEGPEAAPAPPARGTVGDYVGLCLLVQFPDVPGTMTPGQVDAFCNESGYTGFGNNGSVQDYFLVVSDGKLRYRNEVTAYYTTRHERSHYTDPDVPIGTRARELIREALDALKASGFDFDLLTIDDRGFVYALNVFYAGTRVNNWNEGLWPHAWTLGTPYQASATVRFGDYQITDMGTQLTLRTFCHENGHMLCDFPDLYDYGDQSNGIGSFCLMCFGASNVNPVEVGAYLKHAAGWTSRERTVQPGATVTLESRMNDFLVHRRSATEYFIIENRDRTGRDRALPDAGVAIWHVDELGNQQNEQMTADLHYECSLEQADGRFDLERRVNGGDVEDLFGGPDRTRFGARTSPNSLWWDETDSRLEIESISEPGPEVRLTFTSLKDGE